MKIIILVQLTDIRRAVRSDNLNTLKSLMTSIDVMEKN